MIQAFVVPVNIIDASSIIAEFQQMDKYNAEGKPEGMMLVQLRQVKEDDSVVGYHLAGMFVEHAEAVQIKEILFKDGQPCAAK